MIAGGTGLALAPGSAVWLAGSLLPLIFVVLIASRRGLAQTGIGESVAAVVLAGAAAPVAVAGGLSAPDAVAIWLGWSLAYAATVFVVHHMLAHHRGTSADVRPAVAVVLLGGALVGWTAAFPLASFATPLAIAAVLVLIWTPRATHLRVVGIAFLATSILAALLAIAPIRRAVRDTAVEASFRAAMSVHHRH